METEATNVTPELMPDEVKLITECLLNCPMQANVKDMPQIIGMVQGIVKKMAPPPPAPPPSGARGEGS